MTTQTTNCPRCGQPISAGARFCASCGSDLSGQQNGLATAKLEAPRLTHQGAPYLAAQLRAFKSGERRNDIYSRMRSVAAALNDSEIEGLAAFYSLTFSY